jgi:hypothetical protein
MGAGLGMGIGMAAGRAMGDALSGGAQPPHAAPPPYAAPPPPPVERVWHIAEHGATMGPFSRADLGRMALTGGVARSSLVWSPGYDGWITAEDAPELARLFTQLPPPLPPGV